MNPENATCRRRQVSRENIEASLVGGDERSLGRKRTRTQRRPQGECRMVTEATRPTPHAWRPDRFMVIAAHPDDADFGPAGTAARWIDAGSTAFAAGWAAGAGAVCP